jgi:hypothetical protein
MDPSGSISQDPGLNSKALKSVPEKSVCLLAKTEWTIRYAGRKKNRVFIEG